MQTERKLAAVMLWKLSACAQSKDRSVPAD